MSVFATEHLPSHADAFGTPPHGVFRPVQYLGCKLRSLRAIVDEVNELATPRSRVVDLFTGTSVVAQALARQGYAVTGVDAMGYSALFARATLGVDRRRDRPFDELLSAVEDALIDEVWTRPWDRVAADEDAAIANGDADALLRMARTTAQLWRAEGATAAQREQFEALGRVAGSDAVPPAGIATTHYASTYFGVRQALLIDAHRRAIARMRPELDQWQEALLLTALLSAASTAAFSAGKHFAQPHRIRDGKDLSFLRRRIIEDRSIDIREVFTARAAEVFAVGCAAGEGHVVLEMPVERVRPAQLGSVDVVYADPPYTAQQYSRFYHVLEVILRNRVPALQKVSGRVTRGLYPDGKFLSAFSSKRAAPEAFRTLFRLVGTLEADLVLSYSASGDATGNDRMISLDRLLDVLGEVLPQREVRVAELSHAYRQFNHGRASVHGRADTELLVVARA